MRWTTPIALAGLLALAACKVDSRYELFVTDAMDALDRPASASFVNSDFRVEMPSNEKCSELKDKIVAVLTSYYHDLSQAKCTSKGMENYLGFAAKTPLVAAAEAGPKLPEGTVAGLAVSRKDGNEVVLYAVLDVRRQGTMEAELSKVLNGPPVKIEVNSVVIDVNNDSRTDYSAAGPSMFVNGDPVLSYAATLSRRDKVSLALSDVARQKLRKDGVWPVVTFSVRKPPA